MGQFLFAVAILFGLILPSIAAVKKKTPVAKKSTARLKPTRSVKTASSKKKTTTARRSRRRRTPRVMAVSASVRLQATEQVDAVLSREPAVAIENSRALVPFFEQLYRNQQAPDAEPLSILHYGDSHTAADDWTGSVRDLLQSRFGNGGNGYALPGRPFRGYRRYDLKSGASKRWKSEGLLSRTADGMDGIAGVSISTAYPGEYVTLESDCQQLEVFYLQQPGGGKLELTDNGAVVATIETDGPVEPGYFEFEAAPGPHRFELKTLDYAPVRLLGWVAQNKGRGVTYETLGINGAQASLQLRWNESLQASHIARRNPALIVLAYGTNEASAPDWTHESYREMFSSLLQRLRQAAPTSSILVLGPPDRYYRVRGRWTPFLRIDMIVEAQREAALANGCAFWDMREKMGGTGSMRQWVLAGLAQTDHVHFTGLGYRRLGHVLFQDLMYNYERYAKIREELLGQTAPKPVLNQGSDEYPRADH